MSKHKQKFKIVLMASFVFWACLFSNAGASDISRSEVIKLVNKSRAKEGLSALKENGLLSEAAKAKANDMVKNDYFAHVSPSGKDPWYWLKKIGYDYKLAGENLAINYENAKEQHDAWMKSSSHRKNIMNPSYSEIGVAIVEGKIDGEKSLVAVQFFGTPVAFAPAVKKEEAVKNEPVPAAQEKTPEVLSADNAKSPVVQDLETVGVSEKEPVQELNMNVPVSQAGSASAFLDMSIIFTASALGFVLVLNMIIIISESVIRFGKPFRKRSDPMTVS